MILFGIGTKAYIINVWLRVSAALNEILHYRSLSELPLVQTGRPNFVLA